MKRDERLKAIKEIVLSKKVSSQEQLQEELKEKGFEVTQATVSRDINHLRLVKVRNYRQQEFYTLGRRYQEDTTFNIEKLKAKFKESVISLNRAYNILVLKTYPGEAQGVAAIIDGVNFLEVLGTVAGDDTIICIVDTKDNGIKLEKLLNDF
ncbi:MAG: arginine repressor [Actinomycetota bacterium]|jgi:transcriptional regulator of arginine metabolism|nr:arginine repressor [Actinomycetota bacterium]